MSTTQSELINKKLNSSLYKTEMCRTFKETGYCTYGSRCQFAHGDQELRPVARHPCFKTSPCRAFLKDGYCPFGSRCRYLHVSGDQLPGAQPGSSQQQKVDIESDFPTSARVISPVRAPENTCTVTNYPELQQFHQHHQQQHQQQQQSVMPVGVRLHDSPTIQHLSYDESDEYGSEMSYGGLDSDSEHLSVTSSWGGCDDAGLSTPRKARRLPIFLQIAPY